MMNLKSQEKKFYFKILCHIGVLATIGFIIVLLVRSINLKEDEYKYQKDSIIKEYNLKIIEKDSINKILIEKQRDLENQIDYLESVKSEINIMYGKKIKSVYDASAIEHAMWMDSTIKKLNHN